MTLLLTLFAFFLDIPPVATECICAKAKIHDGWCDPCKIGYVAGLKMPSKLFFTTIDHGHTMDPVNLRCDQCKQAMKTDTLCETCRIGFFKGKVYFTVFTYWLARGERVDPDRISCPVCKQNTEDGGWCEACKRGVFGNVAITQREHFDQAVAAYRRLKLGIGHLDKCELCGIAMYSNGMCPKCGLIYKDGKATAE